MNKEKTCRNCIFEPDWHDQDNEYANGYIERGNCKWRPKIMSSAYFIDYKFTDVRIYRESSPNGHVDCQAWKQKKR